MICLVDYWNRKYRSPLRMVRVNPKRNVWNHPSRLFWSVDYSRHHSKIILQALYLPADHNFLFCHLSSINSGHCRSHNQVNIWGYSYLTFRGYCSILSNYSRIQTSFEFKASGLCTDIGDLYTIQLVSTGMINLIRIVYIYLAIQAYRVSKKTFN